MSETDDAVIRVEGVSKTFRLPHEKTSSIKGALISGWRKSRTYEKQLALDDISFEVKRGEFFGIVGRNGSGKSTLLKLLAGIYSPSKGSIKVNGTLTPFIELGVGFNPELTGRENVYLNGALLGFNRKKMATMYYEIVEFAELERFMDQKLKNYSSGMQVRLAFSIAIRAQSDILILDEVLAVGDEAFQQKCIDIFEKYKANKQTIVLVTHDMETIRKYCTNAILVDNGKLVASGDPMSIARKYSDINFKDALKSLNANNSKSGKSGLVLKVTDVAGKMSTTFKVYDEMRIKLSWPKELEGVKNAGVAIHKNSGEYIFGDNTVNSHWEPSDNHAELQIKLDVGPGKYHLVAGLFGDSKDKIIDFIPIGPDFIIKESDQEIHEGLMRLKSEWK